MKGVVAILLVAGCGSKGPTEDDALKVVKSHEADYREIERRVIETMRANADRTTAEQQVLKVLAGTVPSERDFPVSPMTFIAGAEIEWHAPPGLRFAVTFAGGRLGASTSEHTFVDGYYQIRYGMLYAERDKGYHPGVCAKWTKPYDPGLVSFVVCTFTD